MDQTLSERAREEVPHGSSDAAAPAAWSGLVDLVNGRLGGTAIGASDDFFAPCDNLVDPAPACWDEHRYTERGKWMDGWESRRKRGVDETSHDWCLLRLGVPGIVRGVVVDTSFFRGNFPDSARLLGCGLAGAPTLDELHAAEWVELVPRATLRGDARNPFEVAAEVRVTHLRLEIFPDGGVARLRVHGEPLPDPGELARRGEVDLAALENGGRAIGSSDAFFSSPHNLLRPGRSTHMGDGWETRRRRGPGHDWAMVRLATAARVTRVDVETTHFKGNFPESCRVAGRPSGSAAPDEGWRELVPRSRLQAHALHRFEALPGPPVEEVRLEIFPDGGVARLRVWGTPTESGAEALGLRFLDRLPPGELRAALRRCCASESWVARVAAEAPFGSFERLETTAATIWSALGPDAWREAFAGHPRIGERAADGHQRGWSGDEQRGIAAAERERFIELNRRYEERFGHLYLVCASGRSGEELAADLERRLGNDPARELEIAAGEQHKITVLRLRKLLGI